VTVSQPTTSRYARELQTAQRLAREAGAIAMTYFRGDDLTVERKKHDEPVTIADKEASRVIVSGLREAFPDDVVISEENADDLRRLEVDRVWYVDPIDGTKDFIKGRDGFSVMIGLCDGLRPVVGVVYQPLGDRMFLAAPDVGAWFLAPEQPARSLRVSDVSDAGQVRLVASASHRSPEIDQVKSALGIDNEFNIGSVGLKISLISLAERDLYVNPSSHSKTWDTCAPEAILEAAGGRMTDLYGDPLPYDVERMDRSRGMVASNGHVHDEVIARLAPLFPRP
jgi:3'(2'), 5'-bisphosphate nucleotidase